MSDERPLDANEIRNRVKEVLTVRFGDILPHPKNPKDHHAEQRNAFRGAVRDVGFTSVPVAYYSERHNRQLTWADGHLRGSEVADYVGNVAVLDITDTEADYVIATADPIAAMVRYDNDKLDALLREVNSGSAAVMDMLAGLAEDNGLYLDEKPIGNGGDDFDATPQEGETRAKRGDLWALGNHKLLVDDCTAKANVERLMGGEKAILIAADPPYGMGKERDGIANDNLYREKLDAFQMAWWQAARPYVADNGSAYIWGNAEDLWRLWYCGGLRDSERLTFRNEIAWDKGENGRSVGTEAGRMFQSSERCLFFMLGEQGFNINADNYWEGWTPIVEYLDEQRRRMGWGIKDTKRIAGHSENSGCHWFDKSQWSMPTKEVYQSWQKVAGADAFKRDYDAFKRDYDDLKRDYDDLKREFYATRAYFDNAHDNMTDVWQFARVNGDERHDHATPKPVGMIERIIKSSSEVGALVYDPFLGSGTTLIAAERLGRKCYGMEISEVYSSVILRRWEAETGQEAQLLERVQDGD